VSRIKVGDQVTIEGSVTRISEDGAEVTLRLPLYGYPVTVTINPVTLVPRKAPGAKTS
jgi:hypothetical protein